MSLLRGVLLAGRFRTHHELIRMSEEDQRNTLIVVLSSLSNQSNYQAFDNPTLIGMGAVMVFLREAGIRDDEGLRGMSADDQRNTLIVELGTQVPHMAHRLQELSNIDLVLLGLGHTQADAALRHPSYIRGVLLAGRFRTQQQLNQMSEDDQRNTLIVELANHSSQADYQALGDHALAGAGAAMVFLRGAGIRDDAALATMSADDQRNTLIVEINGQTNLGQRLQSLQNLDLVRLGLGVDAAGMFRALPPPLRPHFPRKRLQFRLRDFIQFQSTDDTFQGARDEVYLSALAMDSSTAHFDPAGRLVVAQVESPVIGDVSDDRVRGPWAQNPFVLVEFDLNGEGGYPRSYVVTLLVVEEDNESLADSFGELKDKVRDVVKGAIASAVTTAAQQWVSSAGGSAAGSAAGSAIGGAVGSAAGGIAGVLAGLALGELLNAIGEGLANEVFSPRTRSFWLPSPVTNWLPDDVDRPDWIEIKEHGALYRIVYDWHIVELHS